jgi:hypothetical protein
MNKEDSTHGAWVLCMMMAMLIYVWNNAFEKMLERIGILTEKLTR